MDQEWTNHASHAPSRTTPLSKRRSRRAQRECDHRSFSRRVARWVLRVVLDRQPSDDVSTPKRHIRRYILRFVCQTHSGNLRFRQRRCFDNFPDVREHFHCAEHRIAFSTRKSESCGSCSERFESEMFKVDRRSDVHGFGSTKHPDSWPWRENLSWQRLVAVRSFLKLILP